MPKTKLQIMAQRAIEGGQEAMDYLNLEESESEMDNRLHWHGRTFVQIITFAPKF